MARELRSDECRRICPKKAFDCESTKDVKPLDSIIGQERAVRALKFGLDIENKGFNIFISGYPGTGRRTAIIDFIKELAKTMPVPSDWVYVNNFDDPGSPRAIELQAGSGVRFKDMMATFVAEVWGKLKETFESQDYSQKREDTLREIDEERKKYTEKINKITYDAGFQIQTSQMGLVLVPMIEDRIMTETEFGALPPDIRSGLNKRREEVQAKIEKEFVALRDLEKKAQEKIGDLNRDVASFVLEPYIAQFKEEFGDNDEVIEHVKALKEDILKQLPSIIAGEEKDAVSFPFAAPSPDPRLKYLVNVLVDNSTQEGAPVIFELHPTYYRLFGALEKEVRFGALITNHTMIRAGAAHKANGGFLVLPVEGLFMDAITWMSLKQTISSGELEIEEQEARMGYMATRTLRPEKIPFKVKVIVIGEPMAYNLLYNRDHEFKELFKVKAEFDIAMDRNDSNVENYASFVCTLCEKEGLMHLDPSALAAIVEHSSRLAADQTKMTTMFGEIADVIREASHYAKRDKSKLISAKHIERQIEEKIFRSNLISERLNEMITEGTILIDTKEEKIGQVNGLSVLFTGDYSFGKPTRITASVASGREGVIDIEREIRMGGPSHSKGVMILSGYLHDKYARERPMSLSARLVFEQSYSGVDGDSASSTELYCLLSALSGKPIKQSLAVTGSVNQKGEVQAIGGINEKIEGFFEVCKALGPKGDEGILMPESNVKNLMLRDEVVQAVKKGTFHIYPVKTIDEGIELLTGTKAGKRTKDGGWEKGSIHFLVQKTLDGMADMVREYGVPIMSEGR